MERSRLAESGEYRVMMRDLPEEERPRERLRDRGAAYLTNTELLAILLRTGTSGENVIDLATRLLSLFKGLDGLAGAGFQELCAIHGMGEAKASQLLAALALARRLSLTAKPEKPFIHSPLHVYNLLVAEMAPLDHEQFKVLVLNTKNILVSVEDVYRGTVNSTTIRAAEVFRAAVRHNCPNIIVAHNHPSGDPAPSREDVLVTRSLVMAGKQLEIEVLDHIIIGRQGFVSLKEIGQGFS